MMFSCPCGRSFKSPRGLALHGRRCSHSTDEARFWAAVDKDGPGGCWVWNGYCQRFGHGWTTHGLAHRHAWELLRGPVPEGMFVLHRCDNPPCVNPEHLYLGDHQANAEDRCNRGRHVRGERNHFAKLTAEQVCDIRREYKKYGPHKQSPSNATELASRYGVNVGAIHSLLCGRSWKILR